MSFGQGGKKYQGEDCMFPIENVLLAYRFNLGRIEKIKILGESVLNHFKIGCFCEC